MKALPLKKLAIAGIFVGGIITVFATGVHEWLTLANLKANRDALLGYADSHFWTVLTGAVLIYATAVALSVPGAVVMSLAVGMIFGRWAGTAVVVSAATLGATLVFLAARYLFADTARKKLGSGAQKLIQGFHDNAFHYLLFLRLVPLFPFWLVNLVPAFTPVSVRTYATATALGIIPGSFVFVNLGQSLGRIESLDQLISGETLLAFGLLGAFSLIPVVLKKRRAAGDTEEKVTQSPTKNSQTPPS
ncbi:MAG TPA: TVP38/TMEM64 family protein [Gammaproteobacteria bacterium]|nr:TVP38/TMEM64 family protein [Gammaproteobacteria bacterium]